MKAVLFGIFGLCFATAAAATGRPFLWVRAADRAEILAKIEARPWARAQFDALRARTDPQVARHAADPAGLLSRLPWAPAADGGHPTLPRIDDNMASTGRAGLQSAVQSLLGLGIDCGVLHYLTGDRAYAACAADVLQAIVGALRSIEPSRDRGNGGWLYANDHLYEARALGAQIPLIYDFIAEYVREPGVTVHDPGTGGRRAFALAEAQEVFRTYARLAVEHGMSDTNWPVLEMASLAHNALALDDPAERAHWLAYVTHLDAERQDPLEKIFREFRHSGGIWPESIQYSAGVAGRVTYIVALLRRQTPAPGLPADFAAIPRSLLRLREFRYPNGEYARFGDGPRRSSEPHASLEIAYALAAREGDREGMLEFGGILRSALEGGRLDRARLGGPPSGAEVYLAPLALLWFAPEIEVPATAPRSPPITDVLPFAGLVLQRNPAPDGDPVGGLMAVVSGAAYVHSHASGMALELFGAGHVLGANAGKGRYTTDEHENHRRLFAANNTVIVNGAARSSGGWVDLGIEMVRPVAMEPAPGAVAASPRHSFTVTSFHQEHGAARPAPQERLVGVVRTSAAGGFYVDVFRSRTADGGDEFHDYLYRNVGEELVVESGTTAMALAPQPGRFTPVPGSAWRRNRAYLFPGWHVFRETRVSQPTSLDVVARFTAAALRPRAAEMVLHFVGEVDREYATALAPSTAEAPDGYEQRPTPVLVVRQRGEAWDRPFAVVYEPRIVGATDGIVRVAALRQGARFAGFEVRARVDGAERVHLVIIPPDPAREFDDAERGVRFTGRYAVVTTDATGARLDAYVGEGGRLEYRGEVVHPR